ncbi:MAG: hypothetical protein CFE37_05465 [Alphaproteobacteria bacterium PA4]|nr:MAG: hypothetical protein CFE37_05465 [Alphaproteobacteria bacterium PA4]
MVSPLDKAIAEGWRVSASGSWASVPFTFPGNVQGQRYLQVIYLQRNGDVAVYVENFNPNGQIVWMARDI